MDVVEREQTSAEELGLLMAGGEEGSRDWGLGIDRSPVSNPQSPIYCTRVTYVPVRVSTRMVSPSLTNIGTDIL